MFCHLFQKKSRKSKTRTCPTEVWRISKKRKPDEKPFRRHTAQVNAITTNVNAMRQRRSSRTTSRSEGPYFISGEFDRLEVITAVIPGCSVPSPPVLGCDYAEHREEKEDEPLESLQIKVMTPEGGIAGARHDEQRRGERWSKKRKERKSKAAGRCEILKEEIVVTVWS